MTTPAKLLSATPVVILAGGLGTRLRSVLPSSPKGLARIGDKPFLHIQIELLRNQGARGFVLCVGHLANQIQSYIGNGSRLGVKVQYSFEGHQLLGTAGALKRAERFFAPCALVLNGDTYLDVGYEHLLEHHKKARATCAAVATLSLARVADAQRYGTVLLDEREEFVSGFKEKDVSAAGQANWQNAGAYVVERDVLQTILPNTAASLERDVFPELLRTGKTMAVWRCAQSFYDIGTPSALEKFINHYKDVPNYHAAS